MPWVCETPACWKRIEPWVITQESRPKRGKGPTITEWLFVPTPKQVAFFEQTKQTTHTLFGGMKMVAKSHALRWGLYRDCLRIPNLRCLLLRRTYSELEISHLLEMPAEAERLKAVGAVYTSGNREFKFGNGSLIRAGHCETDVDVQKFLSSQWDRIVFDEVITFPVDMFLAIASCARSTKAEVNAEGGSQVWGGTNPGGRGAVWVKEFFLDHEPDHERFSEYRASDWGYVSASLDDNPYAPPDYKQKLMNLPPVLRRQWLYGDWEAFEGQFFDWQARKDSRDWHVAHLPIHPGFTLATCGGLDWGHASPGSFGLWVGLADGRVHRLDEVKFQRDTVAVVADKIKNKCAEWKLPALPQIFADPALKQDTGQIGEAIGATFARYGVPLTYVSNDRLGGWQRMHEALSPHPDGKGPWLSSDPRCKYFNRIMPLMVQAKNNPEDLDTDTDDHPADEARYCLQGFWDRRVPQTPTPSYPANSWGWWREWHKRRDQRQSRRAA